MSDRSLTHPASTSERSEPLCFDEALGGGAFFGQVGSFEDGYALDALVLSEDDLPHPQSLTLHQRLERFAYLSGDTHGLVAKYVAGDRVF